MTTTTLDIHISHRVAVVWMARETVRNAFNETSIAELTETFRSLGADPDVRAIVLAGKGPAFCAGADLGWMKRMAAFSHDENRTDAMKLATMLRTIYECPKPVIARVHGDAYAGGVGLVSVCDIAVAAIGTSFCLSETRLGLIPATIGPYVIRAMGISAARRYFLTAEKFDASRGISHRPGARPGSAGGTRHAHQRAARHSCMQTSAHAVGRGQAPGARTGGTTDRRRPRRRHGRTHRRDPHQ